MVDGFAERIVRNVEFSSDLGSGSALLEKLLSLLDDGRCHHRSTPNSTRSIKTLDALFAIQIDTAHHAALGDAKSSDDLRLTAGVLNTKLCGEHAKRLQFAFRMLEDGLRKVAAFIRDDVDGLGYFFDLIKARQKP